MVKACLVLQPYFKFPQWGKQEAKGKLFFGGHYCLPPHNSCLFKYTYKQLCRCSLFICGFWTESTDLARSGPSKHDRHCAFFLRAFWGLGTLCSASLTVRRPSKEPGGLSAQKAEQLAFQVFSLGKRLPDSVTFQAFSMPQPMDLIICRFQHPELLWMLRHNCVYEFYCHCLKWRNKLQIHLANSNLSAGLLK